MEPVRRPPQSGGASSGGDAPKWLPIFGGLMAVLLCFFIAFYAQSAQENQRLTDHIVRLQGALSMMATRPATEPDVPPLPSDEAVAQRGFGLLCGQLEEYLAESGLAGEVLADWEQRCITVRFSDSLFFEAGAAGFDSDAYRALNDMARLLVRFGDCFDTVRVEGHTDRVPPAPGSAFRDNWELTHIRAANVARYIYQTGLVEPGRLSGVGCGEFRPIDDTDTARNRRMDFVLEGLCFDILVAMGE